MFTVLDGGCTKESQEHISDISGSHIRNRLVEIIHEIIAMSHKLTGIEYLGQVIHM